MLETVKGAALQPCADLESSPHATFLSDHKVFRIARFLELNIEPLIMNLNKHENLFFASR